MSGNIFNQKIKNYKFSKENEALNTLNNISDDEIPKMFNYNNGFGNSIKINIKGKVGYFKVDRIKIYNK